MLLALSLNLFCTNKVLKIFSIIFIKNYTFLPAVASATLSTETKVLKIASYDLAI